MKKLQKYRKKDLPELKIWLDDLCERVDEPSYIPHDPVSFLHAFEEKKDREIAGFFAAVMAWGRRDIVIAKVEDILQRMNYRPFEFVMAMNSDSIAFLEGFKHRTFKPEDIFWLLTALQRIYQKWSDFEAFWSDCYQTSKASHQELIAVFHDTFFGLIPEAPRRTRKHVATTANKSSAKRLYLYLKWSLRKNSSIDLGHWNFMPTSELLIPLDVHVARQARALGFLTRYQSDLKSAQEVTEVLRKLDPTDPSKYDFALFGLGVLGYEIPEAFMRNPHALE